MTMVERKRVLITVKTYPHPSGKTIESVCTAGITDNGEWIRLYPIPHRYLSGDSKFEIFDWIEVDVSKRPAYKDRRPESYSPDSDSIKIIKHLDSKKDAATRYKYISSMEKQSLEKLIELHDTSGVSLGVIKPKTMIGLSLEKDSFDWTEEQKNKLNQTSLFDSQEGVQPLRKVPYKIKCSFTCDDPECKGHNLMLSSWEYNWTLLKILDECGQSKEIAEKELQKRWMKSFENRIGYLILGTVNSKERYGGTFILIGHCSFPTDVVLSGEQLSLF